MLDTSAILPTGKTAVVMGGSHGLGEAIALNMAASARTSPCSTSTSRRPGVRLKRSVLTLAGQGTWTRRSTGQSATWARYTCWSTTPPA